MDPCQFVRILVGNLAIKSSNESSNSSSSSKPSSSAKVHPSTSSFFCHIHLKSKPKPFNVNSSSLLPRRHIATVPLISANAPHPHSLAACFDFTKLQIQNLLLNNNNNNNNLCLCLRISVYKNRTSSSCAFISKPKLLGSITVPLDLSLPESRACMFHNGWVALGANKRINKYLLHFTVRAEPDPRFVFRFDGEPESSPQVFQVTGDVKQPVFTCKFSFREKNQAQAQSSSSNHLASERKGWSITIHDLSGSPVAAASMVTPFVPSSPGSKRVSRSNPGAWLIIRPDGDGTWKPWGRLEAWRESNAVVGYRFEVEERVTVAGSTINSQHGGKFCIDVTSGVSPVNSPRGSRDFGSGSSEIGFEEEIGIGMCNKGFVMSAKVEGEVKAGKNRSKVEVEVGVQHVTCTEDAAALVALAAAMDLSMDACKFFSQKLRKELRRQ